GAFATDGCAEDWCLEDVYNDSCSGDPGDHVDLDVHMGFTITKLAGPDRWSFGAFLRILTPAGSIGDCPGCGLGVSISGILSETPPDCPTIYMTDDSVLSPKWYGNETLCTEFPTPTMLGINHRQPCNLHQVGGVPTAQPV